MTLRQRVVALVVLPLFLVLLVIVSITYLGTRTQDAERRLASAYRTQATQPADSAAAASAERRLDELNQLWAAMNVLLAVAAVGGLLVSLGAAALGTRFVVRRLERVSAHAEAYAHGEPVGVPVSGKDEIAALDRTLQSMAERIAEREDGLRLALARAEAASRAKSDFVATMSHEIRTPMNAVIGTTELLLETELAARQREYAETIHTAGETLLAVINEILDFSKIEAGRLELEHGEVELMPLVESVATMVAPQAHARKIDLLTHIAPDVPPCVIGDALRLRQVLTNLVGNAVKFTEHGSVTVLVTADDITDDGANVTFAVRDTGVGIDPTVRAKLFEPFRQADMSTTRRFGGTGLGLAIAKQLVTLMKGQIGLESALGSGSTFWFTVPFARARSVPAAAPQADLRGARVLVVDDDPNAQEVFRRTLEAWGIHAEGAAEGAAAVDELRRAAAAGEPYDAALIDYSLGETTDGLSVGRTIREQQPLRELPLLMVTGHDDGSKARAARSGGFAAYLVKPIAQSTLYNALNDAVHAQVRVTAAAAAAPTPAEPRDERVLIVEDNVVNQRLAVRQLQRLGFESVQTAGNGREALVALASERYDLIFMDVQMPVMDGYEAAAEIRRLELRSGRHVPIVAMTANALAEDRAACIAAGMDDYVAKPVTLGDLRRVFAQWLPPGAAAAVEPAVPR